MKRFLDCIPRSLRQALDTFRMAADDEATDQTIPENRNWTHWKARPSTSKTLWKEPESESRNSSPGPLRRSSSRQRSRYDSRGGR